MALSAAACQDTVTSPPDSASPRESVNQQPAPGWTESPRGAAAAELTRLVALAFGDSGLRNRVKNDMRRSPFLEHKLEFASYLRGQSGGILLAKMAQHSDATRQEIEDLLNQLDPVRLEFYMPGDEHRATWTGGPEVVIATQFDESQEPAAYTTDGAPFDLHKTELPDRPVLALVPVETDFDTPPPPGTFVNTRDQGGQAIGIYRRAGVRADETTLDPAEGPGGDPNWTDLPPGLYMFDNWIDDLGEGGLKGDPELEGHLTAPVDSTDENMRDIQCAGQEEPGTFHFNQNDHFFDGKVRVATKEQFDAFEGEFGTDNGMIVSLVEDDDTTCEIKMGGDRFEEFIKATAEVVGFIDAIRRDTVDGQTAAAEGPAILRKFVTAAVNFIETADDEVGVIVKGENICAPDGEHRGWLIQRESETNGCTEMRMNDG